MKRKKIEYETVYESAWLYTLYTQYSETPTLVIRHGSILTMASTSFEERYGRTLDTHTYFFKSDDYPSGKPELLTANEKELNTASDSLWLIERNDQLAIDTYYEYFNHCVTRCLKIIEDELRMIEWYRKHQMALRDGTMRKSESRIDISKGEEDD